MSKYTGSWVGTAWFGAYYKEGGGPLKVTYDHEVVELLCNEENETNGCCGIFLKLPFCKQGCERIRFFTLPEAVGTKSVEDYLQYHDRACLDRWAT